MHLIGIYKHLFQYHRIPVCKVHQIQDLREDHLCCFPTVLCSFCRSALLWGNKWSTPSAVVSPVSTRGRSGVTCSSLWGCQQALRCFSHIKVSGCFWNISTPNSEEDTSHRSFIEVCSEWGDRFRVLLSYPIFMAIFFELCFSQRSSGINYGFPCLHSTWKSLGSFQWNHRCVQDKSLVSCTWYASGCHHLHIFHILAILLPYRWVGSEKLLTFQISSVQISL